MFTRGWIAFFVFFLSLSSMLSAQEVYYNDFEGAVGSEWSLTSTDTTPIAARRFLGQFYNNTVRLSLGNLPSHTAVTVTFDLYILKSWDGNFVDTGGTVNEWRIRVAGGQTLFRTTFSNVTENPALARQAYPDQIPGGDHPARTGADEINTLGYGGDTVYQMSFTFAHTAGSVGLEFVAAGLTGGIEDESWGIDNVHVTLTAADDNFLDINADGKGDVLWQSVATGDVTYWLMNGGQIAGFGSIASTVPLDWRIVAAAEINGDGKRDFIWHNRTTGDVTYWLMNGSQILSYGTIARNVPTVWEIVAAPDLNGDGQFDLLWRNRSNGAVTYWIMNGTTASRYGYLLPPDTNWQVVATFDINRDGHTDILWQNSASGDVIYWEMNGTTWVSYGTLAAGVALEWKIAGRTDLNADGSMDILWRNQNTGAVSYWLMNGTTRLSWGIIHNAVPLEWQIVGLR